MKTLADGTQVSARSFYFLLDFNDRNDRQLIDNLYGVVRLTDLTKHQYNYLFRQAMDAELKVLEA